MRRLPFTISSSASSWRSPRGGATSFFFFPRGVVLLRGPEPIADELLNSHPRLWVTRLEFINPVRLLHVFAQREFHTRHLAGEFQGFRERSPANLDYLILPANWICRAVQNVRGRDAAGQLAVKPDVGGVDHIADAHFASDRVAAFIHTFADRGMRMAIDDARRD